MYSSGMIVQILWLKVRLQATRPISKTRLCQTYWFVKTATRRIERSSSKYVTWYSLAISYSICYLLFISSAFRVISHFSVPICWCQHFSIGSWIMRDHFSTMVRLEELLLFCNLVAEFSIHCAHLITIHWIKHAKFCSWISNTDY